MGQHVPFVTSEQMRRIDELAAKFFGLETVQLMENSGRCIASLARELLGGAEGKVISVLIGKGHNGGDAAVAARFLHNWGAEVHVAVADHPDNIEPLTKVQLGVLRSMYVNIMYSVDFMKADRYIKNSHLIIDGLLGYGVQGDPRNDYATLIHIANNSGRKILSIDIPSGLDPDTGEMRNPCIKAKWTLSMALPKKGFLEKKAMQAVGELWIGDIGLPQEIFTMMELQVGNLFGRKEFTRV
ncbi:MAG: NAD(P)H-hydrate epimerase [Candidatus Aenigmarchaeota archaeon]|nr:NAD(P)H-hydrate epimerase [Candidatus Aenigmarchaeota archaeon]